MLVRLWLLFMHWGPCARTTSLVSFHIDRVRADTYSKSKYASVISQSGGWDWFQSLLRELDEVARKHDADIATVASRWVLDQPQVTASLTSQPIFPSKNP